MRLIIGVLFIIIFAFPFQSCAKTHSGILLYYGSALREQDLTNIKTAIVDPDHTDPNQFTSTQTKFIAYLSLGEIETYRSYWSLLKSTPNLIVEKNPNWKDNYLIDIRSKDWQTFIVEIFIPQIMAKGFDGLFLDTLDTAVEMERRDPLKYAKSKQSLIDLIHSIHKKFPKLSLYSNNGLEILSSIQDAITGAVAEDVYTRYDFKLHKSNSTPSSDRDYKVNLLNQFTRSTKKPVYVILYDDSQKTELVQDAIKECLKNKFNWFVAPVDLQSIFPQE